MAMDTDVLTRVQLNLSLDCQLDAGTEPPGAPCDADFEIPAQQPGCPMMNVCLSMGTGSGHCGLVTVTEVSIVPDVCTGAVSAVFTRSAVQRSGLDADPILHPPIV